jgi:hypothetical protein
MPFFPLRSERSNEVFTKYSRSIHEAFTKYSRSIHEAFTKHSRSIHEVFTMSFDDLGDFHPVFNDCGSLHENFRHNIAITINTTHSGPSF